MEAPSAPSAAPAAPAPFRALDPREPFLVPALAMIAAHLLAYSRILVAAEDAHITFRYARSLASGLGLVYNPGEHVMGFSSPLWTVWCALAFPLHLTPATFTRLTALVLDPLALLAMSSLIATSVSRRAAWAFAVFFAAWPYFSALSASGMETGAFFALIAITGALAAGRHRLAGVALGALALIRPEGVLAALVLSPALTGRQRLVGLGVLAAGAAALAAAFGSPLPQSMLAKAVVYGTPGPWAGRAWWEWLLPAPLGHWPTLSDALFTTPFAVLLAPALFEGVRELLARPRGALFWTIAAGLAVFAAYVAMGVAYFWWYFAVPLASLGALAAVGLPRVVRGRVVAIALVVAVVGSWTMQLPFFVERSRIESGAFVGVARELAARARPGESAFLEPIGFVGWRVPVRVIDEIGLVSPEVSARRRSGEPGWYTDVVRRERPDWLVARVGMFTTGQSFAGAGAPFRTPAERDTLLAAYEAVAVVDSASGPMALAVLKRR